MDEVYQETAMDYLSRFRSLGRQGFLGLHSHPVLLESQRVPATRTRLFMLKTIANEIPGIAAKDLETRLNEEVLQARVIPVGRREADSPGHMIFLGRSPTNAVVILDAMVSKLHAYFCQLPGENGYQLVDMNPMLERNHVFHEASAQMTRHLIHGVSAVEAIDELERIFARQYQQHRDALNKDLLAS